VRVLVVATGAEFSASVRLMATVAAGLSARGDVVAVACASRSATERAIERTWPRLSLRAVTGQGWLRQGLSLRGIVTALRPEALLTGSESDTVLAAFAAGKRAGIVRRFGADERTTASHVPRSRVPWRARLALSGARVEAWGDEALVVSWPMTTPDPQPVRVYPLPAGPGRTGDDVRAESESPHLLILPAEPHRDRTDDRTAAALRVAARLRQRFGTLRVTLLGETAALQGARVHAAAVGLVQGVSVVPLDTLLHHEHAGATAAFIAAPGDSGAIAALAAMQQRIPVVVPHDAAFTDLVAPGITGFLLSPDSAVPTAAELARLMTDHEARRLMGNASAARAAKRHGWDEFVDEAAQRLARSAGVFSPRVTRRPSLTPA
jgi:hypothetical protein